MALYLPCRKKNNGQPNSTKTETGFVILNIELFILSHANYVRGKCCQQPADHFMFHPTIVLAAIIYVKEKYTLLLLKDKNCKMNTSCQTNVSVLNFLMHLTVQNKLVSTASLLSGTNESSETLTSDRKMRY